LLKGPFFTYYNYLICSNVKVHDSWVLFLLERRLLDEIIWLLKYKLSFVHQYPMRHNGSSCRWKFVVYFIYHFSLFVCPYSFKRQSCVQSFSLWFLRNKYLFRNYTSSHKSQHNNVHIHSSTSYLLKLSKNSTNSSFKNVNINNADNVVT